MPRRFLTAEDVRRAGSSEIQVDAETVVTPQALEAAQVSGVRIVNGGGSYTPPAPDRGPDAARAQRVLPNLPEPEENPALTTSAIVTAVGRNRPGVLAGISTAIAELGCNVLDVSQKMVEGYFHMILTVELNGAVGFDQLKTQLECMGSPDDFAVRVMNERVFRYMHRV